MAKTNKEFRSDLAKEMRDKRKERDAQLEQIEKSQFSEGLKENMRKEIKENFEREIDEMKNRPGYEEARKTHLDEIKSKSNVKKAKAEKDRLQKEYEEKLAKADADIAETEKQYEDAQIAHRGEVENEDKTEGTKEKTTEIPQDLKDYRERREKELRDLANRNRGVTHKDVDNMIKVVEQIPFKIEIDNEGSRLIEFELGGKTYRVLDPRLENHTDDEYRTSLSDGRTYVKLKGMMGDDVSGWKNEKLKAYVVQKQRQGLYIPKIEEIKTLLHDLGEQASLGSEINQIYMFRYLTGMVGGYWLGMGDHRKSSFDGNSRSKLDATLFLYGREDNDAGGANLCMMSCE